MVDSLWRHRHQTYWKSSRVEISVTISTPDLLRTLRCGDKRDDIDNRLIENRFVWRLVWRHRHQTYWESSRVEISVTISTPDLLRTVSCGDYCDDIDTRLIENRLVWRLVWRYRHQTYWEPSHVEITVTTSTPDLLRIVSCGY